MARKRAADYPEHPEGTIAYAVDQLIKQDPEKRSMRQISLAAGLAQDSIRNLLKGTSSRPQGRTLEALARVFGVRVSEITGEPDLEPNVDPDHPDQPPHGPGDGKEAAKALSEMQTRTRGRKPAPAPQPSDARSSLRQQISSAVRSAISGGIEPAQAVRSVIYAAVLAAVAAGADESEMSRIMDAVD